MLLTVIHMQRYFYIALIVAIPSALWGYAYEFFYFFALNLSPHKILNLKHYVVSGVALAIYMFVPLLALSQLKKFFSKRIHINEAKSLGDALDQTTFASEIKGARIAFIFSVVFFITAYYESIQLHSDRLSATYMCMVFVNLIMFYPSLALSPTHARISVLIGLTASIAICFAAGGYGDAARALKTKTLLRDDFIIHIERLDGKLVVVPKEIFIPTSWGDILKSLNN